jgi:hypothetical protein
MKTKSTKKSSVNTKFNNKKTTKAISTKNTIKKSVPSTKKKTVVQAKPKAKKPIAAREPLDFTDALISMALDNTDGNCSHDAAFDLFYAATTLMHFSDASTEMLENMLETIRDIWFDYQADAHNPDICNECIAERKAALAKGETIKAGSNSNGTTTNSPPSLSEAMRNKLN